MNPGSYRIQPGQTDHVYFSERFVVDGAGELDLRLGGSGELVLPVSQIPLSRMQTTCFPYQKQYVSGVSPVQIRRRERQIRTHIGPLRYSTTGNKFQNAADKCCLGLLVNVATASPYYLY